MSKRWPSLWGLQFRHKSSTHFHRSSTHFQKEKQAHFQKETQTIHLFSEINRHTHTHTHTHHIFFLNTTRFHRFQPWVDSCPWGFGTWLRIGSRTPGTSLGTRGTTTSTAPLRAWSRAIASDAEWVWVFLVGLQLKNRGPWFGWGFFHLPGEPIYFSKRPPMLSGCGVGLERPEIVLQAWGNQQLGANFLTNFFWLGGFSSTQIDVLKKVGTQILTSPLEDLAKEEEIVFASLGKFCQLPFFAPGR